ncbi:exosortase P [Amycolatopsis cihanbeyliensis]|nr:exosortase P [Amycolatopsis cihanbeyliensis]
MAIGAVLAILLGLVLVERAYRTLEITLSGAIISVISSNEVHVAGGRETVYFNLGGDDPIGLRMTPECSSVFMLMPLLLVTSVLLWLRPRQAKRLIGSLLIAGAAVIAVNQVRVLAIVGLVDWLGVTEGYYWGHTLMGSLVSVLGGALALVLFVWLGTRNGRTGGERS